MNALHCPRTAAALARLDQLLATRTALETVAEIRQWVDDVERLERETWQAFGEETADRNDPEIFQSAPSVADIRFVRRICPNFATPPES